MRKYSRAFVSADYPERVVERTRQYIRTKPWEANLLRLKSKDRQNQYIYNVSKYISDISKIYNVETPTVVLSNWLSDSMYVENMVLLKKLSIVTTLHEFRHYLQDKGRIEKTYTKFFPYESLIGKEEDAIGWSHSLFRLSSPKLYRMALRGNRLNGGIIARMGLGGSEVRKCKK